jgi:hypothetical protein
MTTLAAILFAGLTIRACREVPELAYVFLGLAALAGFAFVALHTTG